MEKVFYQNVKNYVNMFEGTCLVRTKLFVSHGRFVSIYKILKNEWEVHCKFSEQVQLFRKLESGGNSKTEFAYTPGVVF
jgi:hypothetical protein